MRNKRNSNLGVCVVCGTDVIKRTGIPFKLIRCPGCETYTIVKWKMNLQDFHVSKRS